MVLCTLLYGSPVAEEEVPAVEEENADDDDPFNAPVESNENDSGGGDAGFGDDDDLFNAEPSPVDDAAEDDDLFNAPAEENTSAAAAEPADEPQESAQLVFNRQFRAIVQERDAEESAKRQERVEAAESEMDQWRATRAERREKTVTSNREAEQELVESQKQEKESLSSWAQVVKIIDTQANSEEGKTDAARMRSVLIQLKNTPLKPPISAAEPVAEE